MGSDREPPLEADPACGETFEAFLPVVAESGTAARKPIYPLRYAARNYQLRIRRTRRHDFQPTLRPSATIPTATETLTPAGIPYSLRPQPD